MAVPLRLRVGASALNLARMKKRVTDLVSKVGRGRAVGGAALGEAVAASLARRRPFRLWMTGSLAMVMLSLCAARTVRDPLEDPLRPHNQRPVRHSPYGMDETLHRIEAMASAQGLTVFARMRGRAPLLVLASSVGGTPVVMNLPDSAPDMPLSLQVRESASGGTDVILAEARGEPDVVWRGLPSSVVRDIAALPGLVDAALI
jgi:hypothetical protein